MLLHLTSFCSVPYLSNHSVLHSYHLIKQLSDSIFRINTMRIAFMRNTEKNLSFSYNCEYVKCSCTNEEAKIIKFISQFRCCRDCIPKYIILINSNYSQTGIAVSCRRSIVFKNLYNTKTMTQ